jgi:hypothetical protein
MNLKIDKNNFQKILSSLGYKVIPEYKFIENRKFRADWFIDLGSKKVLVEYEGIISSKSRHTSLKGYTMDCEKYNLAQINGFILLRYTAINFQDIVRDLEKIKDDL